MATQVDNFANQTAAYKREKMQIHEAQELLKQWNLPMIENRQV